MTMASPIDTTLQGVVWKKTLGEEVLDHPHLRGEEVADLVVVGAGFCGLNIALHAAKAGLNVILLEAGRVGGGASGRNGGYNVPHFPGALAPSAVEKILGPKKGRALAELVVNGADAVFRQIDEYGISCSAEQKGWVQPAHSDASLQKVRKVHDEWKAFGAKVDWMSAADVADVLDASGYIGGWTNPTGGTVNPYSLCLGLARVCTSLGVRIFENSPVDGVIEDGDGTVVSAGKGRVRAPMAIFATNAYTGDFLPAVQRSVVPVYLYHVATKPLHGEAARTILPGRQCFTDLRKSGGFGRLDSDGRLISGGAVFAFGNKEAYGRRHALNRMKLLFPQLAKSGLELDDYWEGYCAVTDTFLPHVLRLGSNVFSVGGFSTRGVNLAQVLGRVVGEFAAGKIGLEDIPVDLLDERRDVAYWPIKARAARYIFPIYQIRDRLGLT
ncbi:MAG: hypothetical protein CME90_08865 [Hoeflea sp.]|nr:hypothetical protein [Hoeflea sp.]|tara:strand:- start:7463 stop:8785 length:1323 start_codon:yes stop_codon:yes gene_type:complete